MNEARDRRALALGLPRFVQGSGVLRTSEKARNILALGDISDNPTNAMARVTGLANSNPKRRLHICSAKRPLYDALCGRNWIDAQDMSRRLGI
jgi:hypothetical protein